MTHTEPPLITRWLLEHLAQADCDEALAGDLHEEFCSGRTSGWYRRQVFSALAIRSARAVRVYYPALLYAALWSMLAPVWLLSVAGVEKYFHLNDLFSKMDWPWSTLGDLAVMLAANVLFLWTGIIFYLFADLWAAGKVRLRAFAHGIRASLPATFVLWLALIALPKHFVTTQVAPPVGTTNLQARLEAFRLEQRQMWAAYYGVALAPINSENPYRTPRDGNPRDAIVDMHLPAMLARLPFFLIVLCTLWSIASPARRCTS